MRTAHNFVLILVFASIGTFFVAASVANTSAPTEPVPRSAPKVSLDVNCNLIAEWTAGAGWYTSCVPAECDPQWICDKDSAGGLEWCWCERGGYDPVWQGCATTFQTATAAVVCEVANPDPCLPLKCDRKTETSGNPVNYIKTYCTCLPGTI